MNAEMGYLILNKIACLIFPEEILSRSVRQHEIELIKLIKTSS